MIPDNEHPSKQTLFAFAQGRLASESLDQVAEHIEKCATCVDFLEQSVNDTLIDQLREAAIENATNLFEDSFEVHQTIKFSKSDSPFDIESILLEHPKYNLTEQIGAGGMGAVYKARHEIMDREVAIKIIRPEFVSNKEAIARFHTEVRAAAKLSHRNIVAAYDAEQVGNAHFLIMEFVIGESLAETIARKGRLPIRHACNYAVQVAHGLKHAHENGMIHRDIKPQNLMKTPKGVIKILDFGLARIGNVEQEEEKLTSTGVMMGTADYIAPEQARNARDADIRSDLYSLGCTLYFLLAGQPPFKDSQNRVDKILAHCTKPLPDLTSVQSDMPNKVWQIIQKLTAKSPDERFQSPSEVIDELTPFAKPGKQESNTIAEASQDELVEVSVPVTPAVAPPANQVVREPTSPMVSQADQKQHPPAKTSGHPVQQEFDTTEQTILQPDASHSNFNPNARNRTIQIPTAIGLGIGSILLLVILFAFPGIFNWEGTGSDRETDKPGDQKSDSFIGGVGESQQPKLVVAIFAYQKFCFGDFGPFRDELEAEGFTVLTATHPKRLIEYVDFAEDRTPNKHNVQVDLSIDELKQKVNNGEVAAVVIMGGDSLVEELADASSSAGNEFETIYQTLNDQKRWIGAIGKGINLPYQKGFYDGLAIADPAGWLDVTRRDQVRHVTERVHAVSTHRIITARDWHDSRDFGKELVRELQK